MISLFFTLLSIFGMLYQVIKIWQFGTTNHYVYLGIFSAIFIISFQELLIYLKKGAKNE